MEPAPEFADPGPGKPTPVKVPTADRAKVFVTPYVTVPISDVSITDENYEWLKLEKINAETAKTAKVLINIKVLGPPMEDTSWARKMIAVAKSMEPKPSLKIFTSGGDYITIGGKKNSAGNAFFGGYQSSPFEPGSGYDSLKNEAAYSWYLASYSFEPMAVRDLVVEVSCNGKKFPASSFGSPGASIQLNSTFPVVVEPGDVATLKAFRNGKFQVTATYSTSLSNAEVGSVVEDVSGYTSFVFQEFKKEIQERTNSGTSFFIFKNSSSRVSKWLNDEISKNSEHYSSYSKTVIQRNVKSERIVKMMDDFAWPEASIDRVIKDHQEAAKEARLLGNEKLAAAHDDYAAALLAAGNNKAPAVDPVKAASALAQGDFLSFLASGVAIENTSVSGNFTCRRIRSGSFTDRELKQLNAIFLSSTDSQSTVTLADFPFQSEISKKRDLTSDLSRDDFIKIVRESKNVMSFGPWFFEAANFMTDDK